MTLIQLGGFPTAWSGSSMVSYPPPPQYDFPDSPSIVFRVTRASRILGDTQRAATAFIELAKTNGAELPLRVQFGTDALGMVRARAQKTISDGEKWAELSHSTNHVGSDRDAVLDFLLKSIP
jgi:hypothetical protein